MNQILLLSTENSTSIKNIWVARMRTPGESPAWIRSLWMKGGDPLSSYSIRGASEGSFWSRSPRKLPTVDGPALRSGVFLWTLSRQNRMGFVKTQPPAEHYFLPSRQSSMKSTTIIKPLNIPSVANTPSNNCNKGGRVPTKSIKVCTILHLKESNEKNGALPRFKIGL